MQVHLDIYIEPGCANCDQAFAIADLVEEQLPEVEVSLIDITEPEVSAPDSVFAVPTYILNGETCSLGNPDSEALIARMERMLAN